MEDCFCGIDFGTTNSSVALCRGNVVSVVEADPLNDMPTSLPSLLYLPREGDLLVGRAAADAFIKRNVGREVITKSIELGVSIQGYVGSEPDKSDDYRPRDEPVESVEAVRARAVVEVNSPGRLFQSLKSSLRYAGFKGTEVFGRHFLIEELVAMVLKPLKIEAEAAAERTIERAVFGRPVRFSENAHEDAIAERRLRTAATIAGFKEVVFFYEPVAACVDYAVRGESRERLMVVDVGGGTCDVCVMEFGAGHTPAERLAGSRILSVAGVPVAGDALDREIIQAKIYPRFGSRARYGPSRLPMPQHIFNAIADWQSLYRLNTEEIINWLIAAEGDSDQPDALRALRRLIQRNYGYVVTREVEAAKKRLSYDPETDIVLNAEDIQIAERLDREEFAHIVDRSLLAMHNAIVEAEKLANIEPQAIDRVLTTGGTSLVPAVRKMLEQRYGADRILHRDTFVSVAAGLAVVAQYT